MGNCAAHDAEMRAPRKMFYWNGHRYNLKDLRDMSDYELTYLRRRIELWIDNHTIMDRNMEPDLLRFYSVVSVLCLERKQ